MISSQKFKSLLNGGGTVKLLLTEIAGLDAEIQTANAELCTLPGKRADLILGDDPAKEIAKLESRERELEFLVERNSVQMDALQRRLNELRRTEFAPRIEFHKSKLLGLMPEIERAALALRAANDAAKDALKAAVAELGDAGCHLMPVVNIGFVPDNVDMALTFWRGQIGEQLERIGRAKARAPYQ